MTKEEQILQLLQEFIANYTGIDKQAATDKINLVEATAAAKKAIMEGEE